MKKNANQLPPLVSQGQLVAALRRLAPASITRRRVVPSKKTYRRNNRATSEE